MVGGAAESRWSAGRIMTRVTFSGTGIGSTPLQIRWPHARRCRSGLACSSNVSFFSSSYFFMSLGWLLVYYLIISSTPTCVCELAWHILSLIISISLINARTDHLIG